MEKKYYLEKLRRVERLKKLFSSKNKTLKLRAREFIFRGHFSPMFTFVFLVLLGIFLPRTTGHGGCWFAEKTRGRKDYCYGDLRPLKDALARAAGTPPRTKVCLKHLRTIEKKDNRCSCLLSETHSQKLSVIPRGMYEHLDKQGETNTNYRPGSKWCYKCRAAWYSQPELPVTERRKVTFSTHQILIKNGVNSYSFIFTLHLSNTLKVNEICINYYRKTKKGNSLRTTLVWKRPYNYIEYIKKSVMNCRKS